MAKIKTPVILNGKKYWSVDDVSKKLKTSKPNIIVKIHNSDLGDKLGMMYLLTLADIKVINNGLRKSLSDGSLKNLFGK
jgi:hypothetical protein